MWLVGDTLSGTLLSQILELPVTFYHLLKFPTSINRFTRDYQGYFRRKSCVLICFIYRQVKCKNITDYFYFRLRIFIYGSAKKPDGEKSIEDEQTLVELNSAHLSPLVSKTSVQTSQINRIKLFLFAPYNKHFIYSVLTELSRSARENRDLGGSTSVKILPNRPLARLISAKS